MAADNNREIQIVSIDLGMNDDFMISLMNSNTMDQRNMKNMNKNFLTGAKNAISPAVMTTKAMMKTMTKEKWRQ